MKECYSIRMPEIARAITNCWISDGPSRRCGYSGLGVFAMLSEGGVARNRRGRAQDSTVVMMSAAAPV